LRTDGSDSASGLNDTNNATTGAWLTLAHAGATVVAGDTVMIRASAGNATSYPTSSLDYTISTFFVTPAGSASAGWIKWIGYNGIPTIGSPGLGIDVRDYNWFEGLYFVATSATYATYGILFGGNAGGDMMVKDCVLNQNSQAALPGIVGYIRCRVIGSEIYGGSSSPTSSSGASGISLTEYGGEVNGCRIWNCRDKGIDITNSGGGNLLQNNRIYGCVGDGVISAVTGVVPVVIDGNTISANGGHGVNVSGTNGVAATVIRNNSITYHTQGSKYGINAATSSSDKRKVAWGYNNVWNNTGNYNNVTADPTDISVDPGYVDAANGNFRPTNSLMHAGFPTSF